LKNIRCSKVKKNIISQVKKQWAVERRFDLNYIFFGVTGYNFLEVYFGNVLLNRYKQ
jgi:hypothetical protein